MSLCFERLWSAPFHINILLSVSTPFSYTSSNVIEERKIRGAAVSPHSIRSVCVCAWPAGRKWGLLPLMVTLPQMCHCYRRRLGWHAVSPLVGLRNNSPDSHLDTHTHTLVEKHCSSGNTQLQYTAQSAFKPKWIHPPILWVESAWAIPPFHFTVTDNQFWRVTVQALCLLVAPVMQSAWCMCVRVCICVYVHHCAPVTLLTYRVAPVTLLF